MQVGIPHLAEPLHRFAFDRHDGIDLAFTQLFQREPRFDIEQMRLDPETLEYIDRGHEGAGIRQIDDHRLAIEILHAADRPRREHVHFLVEHLGHVDKLIADIVGEVLALEVCERVLAHNPGVDPLQ